MCRPSPLPDNRLVISFLKTLTHIETYALAYETLIDMKYLPPLFIDQNSNRRWGPPRSCTVLDATQQL
jgi:hypothetical protein